MHCVLLYWLFYLDDKRKRTLIENNKYRYCFGIATMMKIKFTVNVIPFAYMVSDFANACLNVLLFIPFGFFLPMLWKEFRSIKRILTAGFLTTSFIEISQTFTNRATDIDDVIINTIGALTGYLIAYCLTRSFTRGILADSKISDFYVICGSVVMIMFFLQPFLSALLWEMVL